MWAHCDSGIVLLVHRKGEMMKWHTRWERAADLLHTNATQSPAAISRWTGCLRCRNGTAVRRKWDLTPIRRKGRLKSYKRPFIKLQNPSSRGPQPLKSGKLILVPGRALELTNSRLDLSTHLCTIIRVAGPEFVPVQSGRQFLQVPQGGLFYLVCIHGAHPFID